MHLVIVPGVMLPAGWSKPTVSVKFVAGQLDIRLPAGLFLDGLRFAIIQWHRTTEHGANPIPHIGSGHLCAAAFFCRKTKIFGK